MTEPRRRMSLIAVAIFVIASLQLPAALAFTDPPDITAILDLYASFDYPPQLKEWRSDGGDPCEESWTGVACFESSIIYLKLNGLNLSGNLGGQLHNLYNLMQLDLSSNSITGGIPDSLPPNITHLNLANNHFSQSLPLSFSSLKNLRHLNMSNNILTGSIGNAFTGLHDLRQLDLSYNNFTGDLPISFTNLDNLTELFLQNNRFTGEVTFLANLSLTYLNIEDNQFSGLIPPNFQTIPNLWFSGNHFDGIGSSMWEFPLANNSVTNVSSPPTTQSSAVEQSSPTLKAAAYKKKQLSRGVIACFAAGGTVATICTLLLITIHVHRAQPLNRKIILPSERSSLSGPPSARHLIAESLIINQLPLVKIFELEELQLATNGFSQEKLVDEGSLGSVYRADFPDGQVLAVKVMNMASASYTEEDEFFEVTRAVHRLRHPNIVSLVGYCMEQGQRILVYEYIKSLSLEVVLHNKRFRPLSWSKRLQIAVEVASALDYLHYGLSPPVAHGNLKAENILLDEENRARISDCGLTVLRPRKSTSSKLMAFRTVIEDLDGSNPPDIDKCKMDVYAFGVLMLELLTGRRPFDGSSRAMEEMCLVKWATPRLHDIELLEQMVDPTIRGTVSPRALSRFADIIAICLLPEQEYRPSISGLVESLEECARAAEERGAVGRSFRSTNSALCGSPTLSNLSNA